jgi:hypothetical protein
MSAIWILSFIVLILPASLAGQGEPPAVSPKAANVVIDPYTSLRLYDGKWDLVPASGDKSSPATHIENHCAKAGEFFTCNQVVNGKNMALVVFLPLHSLENGGWAYRNEALRPEGDDPSSWGKLEIVGDHWTYSNEATEKGKKVLWRTTNLFSGADKIHFEVQRSEDGVKWDTQMSGDEVRVR